MRPITRRFHKAMPDRIVVNVVDVGREIGVIANDMFPISPLPNGLLVFCKAARISCFVPCVRTNGFVNASLIKRHRIGNSASPSGSVHIVWM